MATLRLAPINQPLVIRSAISRRWAMPRLSLAALLLVAFVAAGISLRPNDRGNDLAPGFLFAPAATPLPSPTEVHGVYDRPLSGMSWTAIVRERFQPGSDYAQANPGPDLWLIESGELTISAEGPATITRAGAGETLLTPGTEAVLRAGDGASFPANVTVHMRNSGAGAALAAEAVVTDQTSTSSGTEPDTVVLNEQYDEPVPPPATVSLRRVALVVDETLPASGTSQFVLAAPVTGSTIYLAPKDGVYRNTSGKPLDAYVLTIVPMSSATPAAFPVMTTASPNTAAELQGVYGSQLAGMTWTAISRDHFQPGVVLSEQNFGPDLILVESGELTVKVDGAATMTRAGSTMATPLASSSEVTLGPGDGASIPAGVAVQLRNDGAQPVIAIEAFLFDMNGASATSPGYYFVVLAEKYSAPVDAPASISLSQVTLGANETLPASADNQVVLAAPVSGSAVNLALEGGRYRNVSGERLAVYVLTLTSAVATPAATPSS
jgi:uncharacterized cupin superfamily protein